MIVKFLANKGGGSAAATIDYLLGQNRDRSGAILLSGDPELTQRLADNLDFQNRYTVGVLSFEETNLPHEQKEMIMHSFEETLLAGLDRDQYDITWIEHTDKGRLELNFVIPNVELSTGKRLQPYFDQADRPLVENWKQVTNFEFGLSDPHAPEKAQAIKVLNSQNLPENVKEIKQQIGDFVADQIVKGSIQNRKDVVQTLEHAGFEITRQTEKSISIKNPDGKRNIRLEGVIYENRQFDQQFAEERSRAGQDYQRTSGERYQAALGKLQSLVSRKQQDNQSHFERKPEDHPRPTAEHQKSFAFEYLYGRDTGRTADPVSRLDRGQSMAWQDDQSQESRTRRIEHADRQNTVGKTNLTQSGAERDCRSEYLLHQGEEQQKSSLKNARGRSKSPSFGQISTRFDNAFNRTDEPSLLMQSESLFSSLPSQPSLKKSVQQPKTLEQDDAQRLYESLQRTLEHFRAEVERAKRNKSISEQADRNLEQSESTIENTERGIEYRKYDIKRFEQQIIRSERKIDEQMKQQIAENKRDHGYSR